FDSGSSNVPNYTLVLNDTGTGVTFIPPTGLNNLLTNADFGTWTNSDGIYVADNGFGISGVSADISGTSLTVTGSGATQAGTSPGWIVGDMIVLWANGSEPWASTGATVYEIVTRTDSLNYVVDRAITGVTLPPTGSSGVTDVYLAAPGLTGANALAPDTWYRNENTLDFFRAPISGVSKAGSLYSLYVVKGVNSAESFFWPLTSLRQNVEHYRRFAGRTVTMGTYARAWSANNVFIRLTAGGTNTDSNFHTGNGEWEWLESTRLVDEDTTNFHVSFKFDSDSGDTAYVTRTCLVYGSFIGEGNCVNQIGEVIRFEADVILTNYDFGAGDVLVDVDAELNIEVESKLKIPKGISEIYTTLKAIDSAPADNIGVWMGPDTTYTAQDIGDVGLFLNTNVVADKPSTNNGWVRTDSGGDPWLFLNSSGAATLDLEIRMQGVRIR
ncbi:hypothetical protein LCGC14_2641080, partial [marine sediment metagenome]